MCKELDDLIKQMSPTIYLMYTMEINKRMIQRNNGCILVIDELITLAKDTLHLYTYK